MLYATSKAFLEKFGLRSIDDLPDLGLYAPDDETRRFITARLSAVHGAEALQATADEDDAIQNFDAEDLSEQMSGAMHSMMNDAIAQAAGVVEKIDFDDLEFEE